MVGMVEKKITRAPNHLIYSLRRRKRMSEARKRFFAQGGKPWNYDYNYRGKNIVAHHIKSFAEYPKLRFVVSNGIVLCRKCHQETHKPRRKNYYQKRVLKNYANH